MKKSFMSITMLVASISMVAMLLCGSIARAETAPAFIYDKNEKSETVYTSDKSGSYLTPKLKHEFLRDEANGISVKKAYRWERDKDE